VVAPDEPTLLVLLRGMTESPDLRTLPFVAARFDTGTWRVRAQAAATLNYVALHAAEHRYLPGSPAAAPGPTPRDLASAVDPAMARRWLADPQRRFQAGAFAVWLLAGVHDAEATPYFLDIVHGDTKDPYLRLLGAYGLVRAGLLEYVWTLVGYLGDERHEYQDAVPSLLLEAVASHRAEVADGLSEGLGDHRALGREVSAWTAGAAGLAEVAPALRLTLGDPERRVRCAAAWALGRLGDQAARDSLETLTDDPDPQVRAFAGEALGRLGADPR
jgi:HEAT repeat protein